MKRRLIVLIVLSITLMTLIGCGVNSKELPKETPSNTQENVDDNVINDNAKIINSKIKDEDASERLAKGLYVATKDIIKDIKKGSDDVDKWLDITTKNGENFRIYTSNSNGLQAIKNLDTDEWPVQSFK